MVQKHHLLPFINKTARQREYPKHSSTLSFSFPLRTESGRAQVVPRFHRGNLSVTVKSINKLHVVVTILSAVIKHANRSGNADKTLLFLKKMLWLKMMGGPQKYGSSESRDEATWIIKQQEIFTSMSSVVRWFLVLTTAIRFFFLPGSE